MKTYEDYMMSSPITDGEEIRSFFDNDDDDDEEEKEEMILEDLASRLDKFYASFDPYTYADYEGSYEKTLKTLKEDPLAVVSDLLRIAEDYTA